ncbi:MAG: hypothetical protein KDD46_08185 [Bdellovibrionales bacterium]|nr:hypothetical protein [Bdellovibrionales bacterium]
MKKIALIILLVATIQPAFADQLFGDFKRLPDDIERGFSVSADVGLFALTGNRRTAQNPGFQLALNLGFDIMEYVSIEAINVLGINEADPFDAALQGGVNTFIHELVAKAQYPLGRFFPFFEMGPGIFHSTPDFNFDSDAYKWTLLIAAGFEYYTFLRHYSLYTKYMYHVVMDSPFNAWSLSAGLKYTF